MVQFHLGENSISFSDDFDKLNALRGVIADGMSEFSIYDTMAQLISKHGRMPDVDEFESVFPLMINKLLYEVIVPEIVDFLVENEIYDCSEELFVRKYQENYFDFAKQPQFQNFISHYTDLTSEYMEKRTQKAYDRANRSRWMGGGFGIKGAIKGAAQAAVLNVATGAVRGIGDGISDFASTAAYKSKKNSLLSDDVFHEFDIALNNCIHGCILDFAERHHIIVTDGIAFSDSTPTIANAITLALAAEELNDRYITEIKRQIDTPTSEIYQIRDKVQELFKQRGIVDEQKPFGILDTFAASGSDIYNAILADCADLLNIPTQIARYLDNYSDPYKDDNSFRRKLAAAIVNQCSNYPKFPCTYINTTLDENWAKKEELPNHESVYVGDFYARVPADDIVCMYYYRKGFLESTYTVLTTSGIYYQDDHGTTGYLWKDIKEEPRESYHPKIIFKSKDHIFEFGKDREGLELLKKCIKTAQSPMAQKKISNNKINFGSFLCERLHHNLMPSERSAICLAPSSILFSDSEQRGLVPEKDRSLKLHITQDEFILQHESNPFINFIINLENYEISEGEREKHRIIVLTNNFLYLIGGKGQNVAIHVEDICSFRLEKLNESSYIGISSSKMVYSKYLENPAIDMPSLYDHLNQALVIKPSSEGQLPSAQVRPKEMLQSDKIFCPYCGKKIQRNSNFCCFCGSKINYKK